ncbi:flagellar basal body rod protein FlgC [Gemmobacter serpentinus]|uniref:flagellar basal body rod protein FlgC n=1 Tax=Gemmobacter serpentinus TaxID=2652247 RepID=UPI00124BFFFA|nr:flagellar basal body rod protein FlgC [Gemmobacter serpentinus]
MSDLLRSLNYAASGMQAQSGRLRHVAENIANSDTPGYRRKVTSFQEVAGEYGPEGVVTGPVRLDNAPLTRIFEPGHPLADETGHYDGSNVDLVTEVADAREAQRSYDANLRMFDQARQMTLSLFELLRR